MKTVMDPKTHESALAKWRGAQAKIWLFHVSLSRMVLNLSRKDEQEALYLVAVGCERISGPFHWEPAEVSILTEPPNQRGGGLPTDIGQAGRIRTSVLRRCNRPWG
jgi:hypothetical protein